MCQTVSQGIMVQQTNTKKIALLDRFLAQFDTQILEKQEKHSLFKMSAVTNSRGNANKSLDQCQNLSNYTTTPSLTQH